MVYAKQEAPPERDTNLTREKVYVNTYTSLHDLTLIP
jgi:hypothetical protein